MTLSENSIPANVQRILNDGDLCHVLLEHMGMESYSDALNFAGYTAYGRVKAILWQAVFQHMLVRRRNMCIKAGLDFYETEKKAEAAVKRLKVAISSELSWLLVYAQTVKITQNDPGLWERAKSTIGSWSALP